MDQQAFDIAGVRASRLEDIRLITGKGCYASDWNLDGQHYAAFHRSDRAHARLLKVSTETARRQPGVVAILTGEDIVKAGYTTPPCNLTFTGKGGQKALVPQRPALAHGKVRFVGEALALVVATSAAAAADAADLIEVEYEDLPALVDPEASIAPGTTRLHDHIPDNQPFEYETGDAAAVETLLKPVVEAARASRKACGNECPDAAATAVAPVTASAA